MNHVPTVNDIADLIADLDPEQLRRIWEYIRRLQTEDVE